MEGDPQPSTSGVVMSPRKKRRRVPLTVTEKTMVQNVFKYVYEEEMKNIDTLLGETPNKRLCSQKTADILGIGVASVFNVLKDIKENVTPTSPKPTGPKVSFINKLDEFTFSAIRRKVHSFFYNKEAPTIAKITDAVNEDSDLPNLSKSTVRLVLKHLNFKYASRKRRSALIDRQDIILWRKKYLFAIKDYRREGKLIYYQDETWLNEGHTLKQAWTDMNISGPRQAFLEGLTTGLKAPTGKGKRLIISHIGSEEGFVDGGCLIFESKTNSSDYHKEMNAEHFEEWFKGILPKLKKDSILVLDNAPYHSRKVEKIPTNGWRKVQIQEWLQSKNIEFDESMIKAELIEIVKTIKNNYQKYVVDELAAQYGITILRLPPYHCELNPIELIWAQVKGHVARHNKNFKMAEIKKLLADAIDIVTRWSSCISHVKEEENKMMQLDHLIDEVSERFVINVTDDESESDNSEINSD